MQRAWIGVVGLVGVVLWLAPVGVAGCGDDDGAAGVDAAVGYDGATPWPDGSGPGPDGGGPGPDGSGPGPDAAASLPSCYKSCTGVGDCVLTSILYDADNYQCDANRCRWTGCNNAAECVDTYNDASYTCGTLPGLAFPSCYKSCNTPADCELGSSLHSADNYQCTAGLCSWTGCNSSAECAETYMDSSYVCATLPPLAMPSCYKSCNTPSDCLLGSTLHDADNYQCTSGICEWTGCNNTAECTAAMLDNTYVCE